MLDPERNVVEWGRKAVSRAAFPLSAQEGGWVREKSPGGNGGEGCALRPARARAQSGARTAPAQMRAAKGPATSRRRGTPNGGVRDAVEERYAGTERRDTGEGMANMTEHDIPQRLPREARPAVASRGQSGARTAPARTRARARTQIRAIKGPAASRRRGTPNGGGRDAVEERYAGTEWQSIAEGMATMTEHDIPQRLPGEARRAVASRGQSGARTAPAQTRARARTQIRAIKGPAASRRRGTRNGGGRNAVAERYAQTERQSIAEGMANMTEHDISQGIPQPA